MIPLAALTQQAVPFGPTAPDYAPPDCPRTRIAFVSAAGQASSGPDLVDWPPRLPLVGRSSAMRDVRVRPATEGDFGAIAAVTIATGQHDEWSGTNPAYL